MVLASLGKTEPAGYFKGIKKGFFKWKQLISTFPVFIDKKIRRFGYPKSTQLWWGCPSMHAYFIALPLNIWEKFLMNKFKSVKNCDFPSSWAITAIQIYPIAECNLAQNNRAFKQETNWLDSLILKTVSKMFISCYYCYTAGWFYSLVYMRNLI